MTAARTDLAAWLEQAAPQLDGAPEAAAGLLPRLAAGGVLGLGVPRALGGEGGDLLDALDAIIAVSSHSLAAGFVLWGHRSYVEYLLESPNAPLRAQLLPDLLAGRVAGATGLSNAMKFLAGLEELQVSARGAGAGFVLDGRLPWVTNLRPEGFHVAAAVSHAGRPGAFIASLAHDDPGLTRSGDLDLIGLKATNTAALSISAVHLPPERVIAADAVSWLPKVRPAFMGLQCGMSIGLARRALAEARTHMGAYASAGRHILAAPIAEAEAALERQERALKDGLREGAFTARPTALFAIRIALVDIVAAAVGLELQASGGRAYLAGPGAGFARRWREAAFVPVVTPSLVQLKTALAAQDQSAA